jgi:hypothetical protein
MTDKQHIQELEWRLKLADIERNIVWDALREVSLILTLHITHEQMVKRCEDAILRTCADSPIEFDPRYEELYKSKPKWVPFDV